MKRNCIFLFSLFGFAAALEADDKPIYGRDFIRAQPVRQVEPQANIEPKRNIIDILLGRRATCTGAYDTCTSTGTCCSVIYDTCCSDGTCNTYSDECCLGGGSCYGGFEQCCGPYRCAPSVGVCCDDGESHCNIGHCYLLEGVMQCCTTSRCTNNIDPLLDSPAVGAPPDLVIGTITPFPENPEPTVAPRPSSVVITQYYYTYITWYYYSYYFTIVYNPPTTTTTSTRVTESTYVSVEATDSSDADYQFSTLSDEVATTPDEALSPFKTSGTPIKTTSIPTPEPTTSIQDISSIASTEQAAEPSDNSGSVSGPQIIECVGRGSVTQTCTTQGGVATASAASSKNWAVSTRGNPCFVNGMALSLVVGLIL